MWGKWRNVIIWIADALFLLAMDLNTRDTETAGIYLHIPFCKQACVYCNFHFSTSLKYKEELVAAMLRELEMQRAYLGNTPVETIYFGGGTPSLLSAGEINRLTETIYQHYNVHRLTECTLEANPDDLDPAYLRALKGTPVNRLSIGVQSFKDADLRYMKRAHTAQQADYAIKAAQDAGFTNQSIDLIYGTPDLTDKDWTGNLAEVSALGVPHFSAYALTVEDKTALEYAIRNKKAAPVDPGQAAGQFELLMDYAANNGYEHYEISNLALPGSHAIHNTNYWRGLPYLGVGPSAHSFNGRSRKWNVANNAQYTASILTDKKLLFEEEQLTPTQHLNEYIMTSLRTMWGIGIDKISLKWGDEIAFTLKSKAQRPIDNRLLVIENKHLILTSKGKLFADRIASDLFF